MPQYSESQSLQTFGQDIINRFHPGLEVLKIAFMFREKASHSDGRIVPARTRKCEDRDRQLHGMDFIIEVAKEVWVEADQRFREAIMDHELCSFGVVCDEEGVAQEGTDGRIKTFTRKPDIQEFTDVMERHGAYHVDLRNFLRALQEKAAKKEKPADAEPEDTETPEVTTPVAEEGDDVIWAEDSTTENTSAETSPGNEEEEEELGDLGDLLLTLDGEAVVEFEDVVPEAKTVTDSGPEIDIPELQ